MGEKQSAMRRHEIRKGGGPRKRPMGTPWTRPQNDAVRPGRELVHKVAFPEGSL
ncbi:hypothetical protein HMPREF9440_01273 [Sutterella parvirubra YIT 11816]|uniref:Uncharacterized protein n=1 Tax=Sutterella parvirubra YIT 11816 TaxID=762967 RepID=H3KEV8_9BURK|nr:hypothetical protein HMPREF9440_01273 [Sutterella parvirubra YIT 11816]